MENPLFALFLLSCFKRWQASLHYLSCPHLSRSNLVTFTRSFRAQKRLRGREKSLYPQADR